MEGVEAGQYVALLVAFVAFCGAAYSAHVAKRAADRAADEAAKAERFVARSARYAEWQMHKRKVYADFLAILRSFNREVDPSWRVQVLGHADAIALIASGDLRTHLDILMSRVSEESFSGFTDDEYRTLKEKMRIDISS